METGIKKKASEIIDMQSFRTRRDEQHRRQFERFHLSNELLAFAVLDDEFEIKIAITEVSLAGLSFKIGMKSGLTTERQIPIHFSIRLFLTSKSHLLLPVTITNESVTKTSLRFGCKVNETSPTYEAYRAWLGFMDIYGKYATKLGPDPEAA
jgi:hypothetical protein